MIILNFQNTITFYENFNSLAFRFFILGHIIFKKHQCEFWDQKNDCFSTTWDIEVIYFVFKQLKTSKLYITPFKTSWEVLNFWLRRLEWKNNIYEVFNSFLLFSLLITLLLILKGSLKTCSLMPETYTSNFEFWFW